MSWPDKVCFRTWIWQTLPLTPATNPCRALLNWIGDWTQLPNLAPLTPAGWFKEGHGIMGREKDIRGLKIQPHGTPGELFWWVPPPAVNHAALEDLLKARHKRAYTFHFVVNHWLVRPRLRRLFNKACDFTLAVSPSHAVWTVAMYIPVWIGIFLPFTHPISWSLNTSPVLVDLGGRLHGVLKTREGDGENILRKLLPLLTCLFAVSTRVRCQMLHMSGAGEGSR